MHHRLQRCRATGLLALMVLATAPELGAGESWLRSSRMSIRLDAARMVPLALLLPGFEGELQFRLDSTYCPSGEADWRQELETPHYVGWVVGGPRHVAGEWVGTAETHDAYLRIRKRIALSRDGVARVSYSVRCLKETTPHDAGVALPWVFADARLDRLTLRDEEGRLETVALAAPGSPPAPGSRGIPGNWLALHSASRGQGLLFCWPARAAYGRDLDSGQVDWGNPNQTGPGFRIMLRPNNLRGGERMLPGRHCEAEVVLAPFTGEVVPAVRRLLRQLHWSEAGPTRHAPSALAGLLGANRTAVLWLESPARRLMARMEPPTRRLPRVTVTAVRGEREHFALVLQASRAIHATRLTADPLRPSVASRGWPPRLQCLRVGMVQVSSPRRGRYADALLPPRRDGAVAPGACQPWWITVSVPREARPGEYYALIRVHVNGEPPLRVPLTVRVMRYTLPKRFGVRSMYLFRANHAEALEPRPFLKYREDYTRFFATRRLNPTGLGPSPEDTGSGNPEGLRFEDMERWCRWVVDHLGLNTLAFPGPPGFWSTIGAYIGEGRVPAPTDAPFPEQAVQRWEGWLRAVAARLREHGWLSRTVFYYCDEPAEAMIPRVREIALRLKAIVPDLPLFTTPMRVGGSLSGVVDVFCPPRGAFDAEQLRRVSAAHAAGAEVWWYDNGCGYFILARPAIEGRMLFWDMWHRGVDGVLCWGANWYPDPRRPYELRTGDGTLMYPPPRRADLADQTAFRGFEPCRPGEPVASARLEVIADGTEDLELIRALDECARSSPRAARLAAELHRFAQRGRWTDADLLELARLRAEVLACLDSTAH